MREHSAEKYNRSYCSQETSYFVRANVAEEPLIYVHKRLNLVTPQHGLFYERRTLHFQQAGATSHFANQTIQFKKQCC